jgi:hypothetical protein
MHKRNNPTIYLLVSMRWLQVIASCGASHLRVKACMRLLGLGIGQLCSDSVMSLYCDVMCEGTS